MTEHRAEPEVRNYSRRQALKGVAGVSALAWSVPTMQMISMTPAHADSPSVPTGPGTPPESTQVPPQPNQPAQPVQPAPAQPPANPAVAQPGPVAQSPTKVIGNKQGPAKVQGTKIPRSAAPAEVQPASQAAALPKTGASDATLRAGIAGAAAIGLGAAIKRAGRRVDDATPE